MAVRPIDGNDFMRQLTLDTSKGHYGEFMERSDVKVSHWMPLPAPPDRRPPEGEEHCYG